MLVRLSNSNVHHAIQSDRAKGANRKVHMSMIIYHHRDKYSTNDLLLVL